MPTQEESTTPVVETPTTPAAPVDTTPASAASDAPPPTPAPLVELEDLEWDGEADLVTLPYAQKFPKLFGSLKSRVEELRAKKAEDDLLEKFLSEGDPAVKKELENLRAKLKTYEEEKQADAFEAELASKLPKDIFENDEALEMYLNRVHEKGLDHEEALTLVQAKFAGTKAEAAEAEEEVEEADPTPTETADEEAPAPAPAKKPPPSVLAAKKPTSTPVTRRNFDNVEDVWKHYGL